MSSETNTIGVIRLSALGDAVLLVPLIEKIVESELYSEVVWITTQPVIDLIGPLKNCRFVVVEKPRGVRSFFRTLKVLRKQKFEKLIVAQASFSAHLLSIMIEAKCKIGFDKRRGKDLHHWFIDKAIPYRDEHFVDAYLSFADFVGVKQELNKRMWHSAFKHLDLGFAKKYRSEGSPLIVVNPHASKIERRWTNVGYKKLIESFIKRNCSVVLVGSDNPVEVSLNQEIAECFGARIDNLTASLSLKKWASLLSEADLLVAPDTGAIHTANALNTPTIGLYAVANPKLTGAYGRLENSIDKYPEAVAKFGNLKPIDFHVRVHDKRAMELIEFDDVWQKASQIIDTLVINDR